MKKIHILFIFCFLNITLYSQITKNLFTSEQEFISKATDSVLYIIRQDYVLRDTTQNNPNEYGRGGKEYFGRIYTLAIASENKLWCDAKIRTPWLLDANYNPYKRIDSIKPYLSKTAIRPINQRKFMPSDIQLFEIQSEYDSLLSKINLCYFIFKTPIKEIKNIKETKDSTGWVILAYTSEDITRNDSCNINIAIYKAQPQFKSAEVDAVIKSPAITQNILGGIYINPIFSVGKIELLFSGILNKRTLYWYVSSLPKQGIKVQNSENHLTPINNLPKIEKEQPSKKKWWQRKK